MYDFLPHSHKNGKSQFKGGDSDEIYKEGERRRQVIPASSEANQSPGAGQRIVRRYPFRVCSRRNRGRSEQDAQERAIWLNPFQTLDGAILSGSWNTKPNGTAEHSWELTSGIRQVSVALHVVSLFPSCLFPFESGLAPNAALSTTATLMQHVT